MLRKTCAALSFVVISFLHYPLSLASHVDDVKPSIGMVIALDAPKFEDYDFGKHGKIPLAIPNVRLGTGFAISQACQIITSKDLVQNAVAIAVRLPHLDGSQYVLGSGQPATVTMRAPNADLSVLAVGTKQSCTPLSLKNQPPEVSTDQKLLRLGFGEHLGVYSRNLSQRQTTVTNASVYRSQNEEEGFLVDARTSDSDAGSLLLDDNGQLAGLIAARKGDSEQGFSVSAKRIAEYIKQARSTYVHLKQYGDDIEATSSALLAAFADHVLESQKDDSDHHKRYFLEERWRNAIIQSISKSELLQDRPAVILIYALAWNFHVNRTLTALDSGDVQAHAESCKSLVELNHKMVQIKNHPSLSTSAFVQDNLAQYERVAKATKCQELLELVNRLIAKVIVAAAVDAQAQNESKTEQSAKKADSAAKPPTTNPAPPLFPLSHPAHDLSRFGVYVAAGGSFADPTVLGNQNLSGQVAFQVAGGGLIRLFSAFYRNRLEYSLLAGLGIQWHHSSRILNPYIDLGMRLRVGLPVGVALTVLYAPGMLVNFPSGEDNQFAFSWSVLKAQLGVFVHWFGIGVGWSSDLRTVTVSSTAMDPSTSGLFLPGHTLSGFMEFFY